MTTHRQDEDFFKGVSVFLAFVVTGLLVILFFNIKDGSDASGTNTNDPKDPTSVDGGEKDKSIKPKVKKATTTCIDVTSIDYNWDNDVLCTRPDGTKFYTDYAGGRRNDPSFNEY